LQYQSLIHLVIVNEFKTKASAIGLMFIYPKT